MIYEPCFKTCVFWISASDLIILQSQKRNKILLIIKSSH